MFAVLCAVCMRAFLRPAPSTLLGLCTIRASMLSSCSERATWVTTTTDDASAEAKIKEALLAAKLVKHADDIKREVIRSFYWWEGRVQDDAEVRLSFETSSFETALSVLSSSHNYDVPMIVGDGGSATDSRYWKGVIVSASSELAAELAGSRLVACAQLADGGGLTVKTTAAAKAPIEARLGPSAQVRWEPIIGNSAYLDWVVQETKVCGACGGDTDR